MWTPTDTTTAPRPPRFLFPALWQALTIATVLFLCGTGLLAADAPVSYRLQSHEGRTVIAASTGELIPWASYSLGADVTVNDWLEKHKDLVGAGVHLFQMPLWDTAGQLWWNPLTSMDGEPLAELKPSATWHIMPEKLLELDPEARFIMRFSIMPDLAWRKAHLELYPPIAIPGGSVMRDGHTLLPSLAAELATATAVQSVRDAVAWCERQPWRDRIVGYTIFIFGEGASDVALFGQMFDTGEPMQQAFKAFVRERYGNDAALAAAWQRQDITLDDVTVPTLDEWLERKERDTIMHWPDPAEVRRERDYFECQKALFHQYWSRIFDALQEATADRPVLKGCDNFKQHMLGWLHNAGFSANSTPTTMDTYNGIMLASGALGSQPLLDHPGLDMLQTPGMYYSRAMGHAWEAEGLSDSLVLRGKVNFMEADMRTWVRKSWRGIPFDEDQQVKDAGAFMTETEMRAGFDRTLAWALSRNQMFYYASVCGANWWYHAPPIVTKIAQQVTVGKEMLPRAWHNRSDVICLVVDDNSPLYEDFSSGFQYLAMERQLEDGLAMCGVPYRIHLLSDLRRPDFPDYKCYLFPNLFKVDAATETLLHEKVLRNGNVAIFGPGTGITDGVTRSAEPLSRLLGVDMELIPKRCARRVITQGGKHPLSRRLPTITYGDSHAYGPLLVPRAQRLATDGSAQPLGTAFYFYFIDRPGLFVNDVGQGATGSGKEGPRGAGDYSVIFTPAVPLPAPLLREFARYAGCHVWSEENAVVYASAGFVAMHTARAATHRLQLPGRVKVQPLGTGVSETTVTDVIEFVTEGPETRMFLLEPVTAP